ncbi:PocR ligand-binding domain-containing protein [Hydrogenoanaerobacterium sp.]|uniref:PocR ligand-binding domain-containing protein n=1 Tax=Hydrogenoanaerobacterium sp. TaxID=2953763 RepID=UPI00289FE53D|nr:PocR ligand-binding domain-containing protein [Hydrogenoanaerobacterium sp.]
MDIVFDKKELFRLLKDYHTVTNLRVGVYDLDFREICAYPVRHSGFCKIIRSRPEGLERCVECDKKAFTRSAQMKEVYIYCCHAGLTEATAPILDQGRPIGYVMIGQMRTASDPFQWSILEEAFAKLGIEIGFLENAFYNLKGVSYEDVSAYASILQACAAYIWMDGYIRIQQEELPKKLEQYLNRNLSMPLTLPAIAEALGISKTTLCRCTREEFNSTVGALLCEKRIARAKELLRTTSNSIASVAEQVGISDYNYFSKLFRAKTGFSPSAYRRNPKAT